MVRYRWDLPFLELILDWFDASFVFLGDGAKFFDDVGMVGLDFVLFTGIMFEMVE